MANYTAWRGALEITLSGFPVPINIALENRTAPVKAAGFSLLSPTGLKVSQRYVSNDGWEGSMADCSRGVNGTLIPDEVVKAIGESERSLSVEPDSFAPLDSIDFSLATGTYAVIPDDKIPAAARQVSILWNGLRHSRLAYITRIVMRAGSLDRIVAVWADERGLWAVGLPFGEEIKPQPELAFEPDDRVGEMFAQAIAQQYEIKDFDPSDHPAEQAPRRMKLIEQALSGQEIKIPEPKVQTEQPDLMAALEASLHQAKPKSKPKKKKAA
jgi:non-homologous end joining protein Ku